jgi:hypothetical protein
MQRRTSPGDAEPDEQHVREASAAEPAEEDAVADPGRQGPIVPGEGRI